MKPTTDQYKSLQGHAQGIYKDKGSKFIALSYPVTDTQAAQKQIDNARRQYHNARHHCYAYRIGYENPVFRIHDDGEPSGTAGKPIYGQILSHDLFDVLVIVVRYFGGTKLGVRGLINAYKGAAADAIENNTIITKTIHCHYRVHFDYPSMNPVMRILKEYDLPQHAHDFALSCHIDFSVRKDLVPTVLGQFGSLQNIRVEKITEV